MNVQVHRFVWHDGVQDVDIEVLYFPLKWGVISHFEFRTLEPYRAPLPITETGYLSHFFHPDSVDFSKRGVVAFITDWLDKEATRPEWNARTENARQLELF